MMEPFKYQLGVKARSKVTGFEGTITSRAQAIYGCDRYYLHPRIDKEGKIPDGHWFDEADVEVIEEAAPLPKPAPEKRGGPITRGYGSMPL